MALLLAAELWLSVLLGGKDNADQRPRTRALLTVAAVAAALLLVVAALYVGGVV